MYINNIKLHNNLYSRVRTQLLVDVKKPVDRHIAVERVKSKLHTEPNKKNQLYQSVYFTYIEYITYINSLCK